ncbi:hypothetical protein ACOMHN_007322 [Nucella lapillus]
MDAINLIADDQDRTRTDVLLLQPGHSRPSIKTIVSEVIAEALDSGNCCWLHSSVQLGLHQPGHCQTSRKPTQKNYALALLKPSEKAPLFYQYPVVQPGA